MKTTYLQQLNAIAKRAKNRSFWAPASTINIKAPSFITRHVGTAY